MDKNYNMMDDPFSEIERLNQLLDKEREQHTKACDGFDFANKKRIEAENELTQSKQLQNADHKYILELEAKLRVAKDGFKKITALMFYDNGTSMNDADANVTQVKIAREALSRLEEMEK